MAFRDDDNTSVNLTSLNVTITLSFFGMFWSIANYILFTKWKCIKDQTIWENQLLPLVKPIWDNYGYPFLYTCCCALCLQKPGENEKDPLIGVDRKPSQHGATPIVGDGGANGGPTISGVSPADEYQHETSIKGASGYHSIDGDNSPYEYHSVKSALDAGGYQSVTGYQTVKIDSVNDEEKALPGDSEQPDLTPADECEHKHEVPPSDAEQPKKPLLGSSGIIFMFSLIQILARPFIIVVNIVYIVLYQTGNVDNFLSTNDSELTYFFAYFSYYMIYQETIFLISGPISNAMYWVCCWRQCRTNNSCRKFLEFMRFSDLQFVILAAPFSNVHLIALGGWWYIALIVRLTFYAVTFASAVVAGMRFVCACYCRIFFTCGCDNDVLEIRNIKQLILKIGLQLIPIFLKIYTSSSAIATFVTIGAHGGASFRQAYAAFSMIRSITALFSLGFTGAMLRWAVLKEEHKWENRSWLTKWLRFLNKYQPHIHGSFFFDMITYFPLILLNLILLDIIDEKCFYQPST